MTIVIAIGRNVGDVSMSLDNWTEFKSGLNRIAASVGTVVFSGSGVGLDEGVAEDSYVTIVAPVASRTYDPDVDRTPLEASLSYLALRYGQKSIAVVYGETTFVEP